MMSYKAMVHRHADVGVAPGLKFLEQGCQIWFPSLHHMPQNCLKNGVAGGHALPRFELDVAQTGPMR